MKTITSIFTILLIGLMSLQAQNWNVDASHSTIGFTATHMLISEVDGKFNSFDATITSSKDDFSDVKIEFTADVNSINTDNEKRDGHLKSADFFDAGNFPELTFKSTKIKKGKDNTFKVIGDLTIRGVTKQVELAATYGGTVKDPWGNTRAGFKLQGSIDRFDYGLKWDTAIEAGGLVVSKDIELDIKVELTKAG